MILVVIAAPAVTVIVGLCAAVVMLDGNAPFYSQRRIGRHGASFRMWKLRTMVPDADAILAEHLRKNPGAFREWNAKQKLAEDPRITAVGRLLRKSSLDELPQILNVLKGDMSLVGPRPIMLDQERIYSGGSYYEMRPGLTGPWQVSERNATAFQDRVRYDELYFRNISFWGDARLILKTFGAVIRSTGL